VMCTVIFRKEDVTQTLYSSAYKMQNRQNVVTGKVDAVCEAVQKALERINPSKYVNGI
jgi:hypothetical protein